MNAGGRGCGPVRAAAGPGPGVGAGRDGGSVLVTGGAGYVGSHVVLALCEAGYRVVVLDDLSTGRRAAVPPGVAFVEGDAGDAETAGAVIAGHAVNAVAHLAASSDIAESLAEPLKYRRNNSRASATLIRACIAGGIERFLFASSAAVYGIPGAAPAREDTPASPVHPYGRSKLATERLLRALAPRHGLRYAALRYFNVAGADPLGRAGPFGPTRHLVRTACQAALGLRAGVTVFGTDYPTPDGTCVRDYIHVSDLAAIHVAVLRGLENGASSRVLNCASGRGVSVRQVLAAVRSEAAAAFGVRDGPAPSRGPPGPGRRYRAPAGGAALVAAPPLSPRHGAQRARLGANAPPHAGDPGRRLSPKSRRPPARSPRLYDPGPGPRDPSPESKAATARKASGLPHRKRVTKNADGTTPEKGGQT